MSFASRWLVWMAAFSALLFSAGCGDDAELELRVRLVTSFVAGPEFETVEVALLAPTSQLDSAEVIRTIQKSVDAADSFTRGAEVATFGNVDPGAALIRVQLKRPDGTTLVQRRVSFEMTGNNSVTVYLTRDCAGVTCPGAGGAALTECFAGTCVDPKCDPNNAATRAQFCGTATFCDAPSDCPFVQSCAQPWCTDGVCIPEPLTRGDDACESGEYCNPTTGCVPTEGPPPDGGVPGNCSMNNGGCMENQLCQNGPDGPICAEDCVSGYVWNSTTMMCDPRCTEDGYVWSPSEMECVDVNECENPEACDQICTNTVGSFECSCVENATLGSDGICYCDSGFREEGETCVDVNECLGEGDVVTGCLTNELCTNIPGSYHCGPCKPGYFRSGSACAPGQIEGGSHFSCTLGADGRVSCWGANSALYDDTDNERYELGSLGTGDTLDRRLPQYVTDESGIEIQATQIALGAETAYALQDDGTVLAWGANFTTRRTSGGSNVVNAGQLGTGSADKNATRPIAVTGIANAIHVVAGRSHACALIDDDANRVGTIKCWGDNSFGQVGNNTTLPASGTQQRTAADVVGIDDAVWITAGAYHTCALRASNNKVVCWGRNDSGQLGDGTMTDRARPGLTAAELDANAVRGIEDVTSVVAGGYHTCAIDINRRVSCWGDNSRGQLGLGDTTSRSTAMMIPDLEEVRALSTGKVASELEELCAAGGTCAVHSGSATTCALYTTTGIATAIKCWGANTFGQVGMGSTSESNVTSPTTVVGINDNMTMIGVGGAHACALNTNGNLAYCWGSNQGGALGDGNSSFIDESNYRADLDRASAQRIQASVASNDDLRATSVSMGDNHGCVVLRGAALPGGGFEGGEVRCWGSNESGQLGVGVPASFRSQSPLRVAPIEGDDEPFYAKTVAVGREHSCAIRNDNTVVCWGDNTYGQLGFDTEGEAVDTPTVVGDVNLAGAKAIAVGDYHTCVINGINSTYCWGRNDNKQIGAAATASLASVSTPTFVGTGFVAIGAGAEHTCGATASAVSCWGRNDQSQLGNNGTTTATTPFGVGGGGGFGSGGATTVVLGGKHTCALRTNQTWCWGDTEFRQNGHWDVDRNAPFRVFGSTPFYSRNVAAIGAGRRHTCASIDISDPADGVNETICWGLNDHGQLGNGAVSTSPVWESFDQGSPSSVASGTYGDIVVIDHETGEPLTGVVALEASDLGTIAILSDGTLRMWGENSNGELGFGHIVESFTALAPWRDWQ